MRTFLCQRGIDKPNISVVLNHFCQKLTIQYKLIISGNSRWVAIQFRCGWRDETRSTGSVCAQEWAVLGRQLAQQEIEKQEDS